MDASFLSRRLLHEPWSVVVRRCGDLMALVFRVWGSLSSSSRGLPPPGLPALAEVEAHSPSVIRLLAHNPGRFELHGTNCYVVGQSRVRCLIDAGEGKPEFEKALVSKLEEIGATLGAVLVTHRHRDHVGGAARLKTLFPGLVVRQYPKNLKDGERIVVDDATTLRVLYAPGHCDDHCCFVLEEEKAIFSGDNVLGFGTTWFEHLPTYMASLQKMLDAARDDDLEAIYPGHGPPGDNAVDLIARTASHRRDRETQIVMHLHRGPLTSLQLVNLMYSPELPRLILNAAQSVVLSHLGKLRLDNRVARLGLDLWALCDSTKND
ncbi:hypothetical protein CTAYLR_002373 [Chrysophaeum taylorii]|uniref:Metallo-beta-lactamase domain-containing protein n=1 Tax=Chrysophaeum taylorii TaxID=2483200 RepID=A0AAD7UG95_9STRA|nr:hypothetical protein CTAYLR_002373 [Chrysophaeum taylorii]